MVRVNEGALPDEIGAQPMPTWAARAGLGVANSNCTKVHGFEALIPCRKPADVRRVFCCAVQQRHRKRLVSAP